MFKESKVPKLRVSHEDQLFTHAKFRVVGTLLNKHLGRVQNMVLGMI